VHADERTYEPNGQRTSHGICLRSLFALRSFIRIHIPSFVCFYLAMLYVQDILIARRQYGIPVYRRSYSWAPLSELLWFISDVFWWSY
jgi:hypothetical protein